MKKKNCWSLFEIVIILRVCHTPILQRELLVVIGDQIAFIGIFQNALRRWIIFFSQRLYFRLIVRLLRLPFYCDIGRCPKFPEYTFYTVFFVEYLLQLMKYLISVNFGRSGSESWGINFELEGCPCSTPNGNSVALCDPSFFQGFW